MYLFLAYHFFSRRLLRAPKDGDLWMDSWEKIHIKTYGGCPLYSLSPVETHPTFAISDITKILLARSSKRNFTTREEIPSRTILSNLLGLSCGEFAGGDGRGRYKTYPSGGRFYPVETYVFISRSLEDLPAGMYHYRPDIHGLEFIHPKNEDDSSPFFSYDWANNAPVQIFFTGTFAKNVEKYGERAYRYALLEAGHMSQNVSLLCAALGLRSTEVGGSNDAAIERCIGIDGVSEMLLHSVVIG